MVAYIFSMLMFMYHRITLSKILGAWMNFQWVLTNICRILLQKVIWLLKRPYSLPTKVIKCFILRSLQRFSYSVYTFGPARSNIITWRLVYQSFLVRSSIRVFSCLFQIYWFSYILSFSIALKLNITNKQESYFSYCWIEQW